MTRTILNGAESRDFDEFRINLKRAKSVYLNLLCSLLLSG